jgi:luciferase family oxidoreductase group 1
VEALALKRERKTRMPDDFPEQVGELLAFLGHGEAESETQRHRFPSGHPFAGIRVSPEMPGGPDVWMLGSSMWSAAAAVEFGLPYSFAHFFSPVHTRAAIETYRRGFSTSAYRKEEEATVAVGVICAETEEEAEFLSSSVKLLQRRIRQGDRRPVASPEVAVRELEVLGPMPMEEGEWPRYFVGTPSRVREQLEQMAGELGIGELIVNTIVWDQAKRLRSYELLAESFSDDQRLKDVLRSGADTVSQR